MRGFGDGVEEGDDVEFEGDGDGCSAEVWGADDLLYVGNLVRFEAIVLVRKAGLLKERVV